MNEILHRIIEMPRMISKSQFKLAVKAVSNGVYYSAFPDKREAIQKLAIEDLGDLPEENKEKYMALREFGKDLYLTCPKGTSVDDVIMEYVDSVFDFIKKEEGK